ncbi:FkbM family methyltransferase [Zoogloea sp.]|uniref:FkbM family methyltransferase n=1 Tax=Zoogloea sp. TaxID=49181 RepID=UPI0035B2E779
MSATGFPSLSFEDADAALVEARRDGVLIFGCGSFARDLHAALVGLGITVRGFVVSRGAASRFADLPVAPLTALPGGWTTLPLWIGVFNREPGSDHAALASACEAAGFSRVLLPQQYCEALGGSMGWRYWLDERQGYAARASELHDSFAQLEDEPSRAFLADILRYRLGQIRGIPSAPVCGPQYFPDFLTGLARGPLGFVDAGAYNGDTLAEARRHLPLREAWAFEPDPANFPLLAERARSLGIPVTCLPCGVSSENASLAFSGGHGEASTLGGEGNSHIQVLRLDDCLPNARVDYLKLDVEGHEMEALTGAEALIRRNRPILAIAGYHRRDDLWRIPAWIASLDLNYRLRLRIHAHNSFDAVFYAY